MEEEPVAAVYTGDYSDMVHGAYEEEEEDVVVVVGDDEMVVYDVNTGVDGVHGEHVVAQHSLHCYHYSLDYMEVHNAHNYCHYLYIKLI